MIEEEEELHGYYLRTIKPAPKPEHGTLLCLPEISLNRNFSKSSYFRSIFNLENHIDLEINNGILLSLQKQGKEVGPLKDIRPITLLNAIRNALSIVTLNRIREKARSTYLTIKVVLDKIEAQLTWHGHKNGLQQRYKDKK